MRCPIDYAEREYAHQRGIDELRDEAINDEFDLMLDERHTLIRHIVDEFADSHHLPESFTEDWFCGSPAARLMLTEDCVLDKALPEIDRRITLEWDD